MDCVTLLNSLENVEPRSHKDWMEQFNSVPLICLLACLIGSLSVCLSVCVFVCLLVCFFACLVVCLFWENRYLFPKSHEKTRVTNSESRTKSPGRNRRKEHLKDPTILHPSKLICNLKINENHPFEKETYIHNISTTDYTYNNYHFLGSILVLREVLIGSHSLPWECILKGQQRCGNCDIQVHHWENQLWTYKSPAKPGPSLNGCRFGSVSRVSIHHPLGCLFGTPWNVLEGLCAAILWKRGSRNPIVSVFHPWPLVKTRSCCPETLDINGSMATFQNGGCPSRPN